MMNPYWSAIRNVPAATVLRRIVCVLVLGCCGHASAQQEVTDSLPWSWDTVQRAIYLSSPTELTPTQFDYLASHFQLVVLAIHYAWQDYHNYDLAMAEAARQLKSRNPNIHLHYYINASRIYRFYPANDEFHKHPSWSLDPKRIALTPGRQRGTTLGNTPEVNTADPDAVDWMVRRVQSALEIRGIDGIWLDGCAKPYARGGHKLKILRELYPLNRFEDGLYEMYAAMRKVCDEHDAVLIGNVMQHRPEIPVERMTPIFSGIFLEFQPYSLDGSHDVASMKDVIERTHKMAKRGQAIWSYLGGEDVMRRMSPAEKRKYLAKHIEKRLAIFLLTAQKYSYFDFKEGHKARNLWMFDLPEFQKPLGKPFGDMKVNGSLYTREFERCSVTVNLEDMTRTGIDWYTDAQFHQGQKKRVADSAVVLGPCGLNRHEH